jgi:thiol-disulfide isomerase/thioredoxin
MKTTEILLLSAAVLLTGQPSSSSADAFLVVGPTCPSRPQHMSSSTPSSPSALNLIADVPIEDHEKQKKGNGGDGGDDAWIPSKDGGFIPNIKARLTQRKNKAPPIIEVTDIQGYKREVAEETDRMVCVRFYAKWCRACKAVMPMFRQLPQEFPGVKFVEVPLTKENAYLHKGLEVPSLPFGHLYHPDVGLVEERKISKDKFNEFKNILKTYVDGECKVKYPEEEPAKEEEVESAFE